MATRTIDLGSGDSSIGCVIASHQRSGGIGLLMSLVAIAWAFRRRFKK